MEENEKDDESYPNEFQQIEGIDDQHDRHEPNGTDDQHEPNGAPFWYVNKDGFPMTSKTLERMWDYVERIHPDGAKAVFAIKNNPKLPKVPPILYIYIYYHI